MKNNRNKGQSLFEIIVALSIVSLIAAGLVKASGFSVRNIRFSVDQSSLTALAQKRIAQIVEQKNLNPTSFWEGNYFPLDDFPCSGGSTCIEKDEDYCLKIKILDSTEDISLMPSIDPAAKMVTIVVDAYWGEDKSGTDCGEFDYHSHISFKTNVTN